MTKYDETLRFEAALCVWENMLDAHFGQPINKELPPSENCKQKMANLWDKVGTVEMRHKAISYADKALETFDLISGHEGMEELDLVPYDWGFIEAFVARIDWEDGGIVDPKAIAAQMSSEKKFDPKEKSSTG